MKDEGQIHKKNEKQKTIKKNPTFLKGTEEGEWVRETKVGDRERWRTAKK